MPSVAMAVATMRVETRVDLIDIVFLSFRLNARFSSFRHKRLSSMFRLKTDGLVRSFRKFHCRSARHYADAWCLLKSIIARFLVVTLV